MTAENSKRTATRTAALIGALGGLTVLLTITRLGFIPWFAGAAITVLHVPVILAVCLGGFAAGISVAAIFGLSSLVMAAVLPSGPLDPFFVNPLISVLPRILFGVATFFLFKGFILVSDILVSAKKEGLIKIFATGFAAFTGTLVHAVCVLGILVFAKAITWKIFLTVFVMNTFLEAGSAMLISIAVISASQAVSLGKSKGSKLLSKTDKQ